MNNDNINFDKDDYKDAETNLNKSINKISSGVNSLNSAKNFGEEFQSEIDTIVNNTNSLQSELKEVFGNIKNIGNMFNNMSSKTKTEVNEAKREVTSVERDLKVLGNHTVVAGDTLWALAAKYYGDGSKYKEIANANGISNPSDLVVGKKLIIPKLDEVGSNQTIEAEEVSEKEVVKTPKVETLEKEVEETKEEVKKNESSEEKTEKKETLFAQFVNDVINSGNTDKTQTSKKVNKKNEEYRLTSYYSGDSCGSGRSTGSGKKISDFKVNDKGWYTYNGKLVVATATEELLKTGYSSRQEGKHYFKYGDEITIEIDGVKYPAIVLDSCGAAMWKGETRVDLFVANSSSAIDRGYQGENSVKISY